MVKYTTYVERKPEEFINPMTDYNDFRVDDVNTVVRRFNNFIDEYGCVDLDTFYTSIISTSIYNPSYEDVNYGWTQRINIKDNFVIEYNHNSTQVYFGFNLPAPKLLDNDF